MKSNDVRSGSLSENWKVKKISQSKKVKKRELELHTRIFKRQPSSAISIKGRKRMVRSVKFANVYI